MHASVMPGKTVRNLALVVEAPSKKGVRYNVFHAKGCENSGGKVKIFGRPLLANDPLDCG